MVTAYNAYRQDGTLLEVEVDGSGGIACVTQGGTTLSLTIDSSGGVAVIDQSGTVWYWGPQSSLPALQTLALDVRTKVLEVLAELSDARGEPLLTMWDNAPCSSTVEMVALVPTVTASGDPGLLNNEDFWVRVGVSLGASDVRELGGRCDVEVSGEISLGFVCRVGLGDEDAKNAARIVTPLLRDYRDGNLRFGAPSVVSEQRVRTNNGSQQAGGGGSRWNVNLRCGFTALVPMPTFDVDSPVLPSATTFDSAMDAIRSRWRTHIEISQSLPTAYENNIFDHNMAPNIGGSGSSAAPRFARLFILAGDPLRIDAGPTAVYRTAGFVQASILTEVQLGISLQLELKDAVFAAFSGATQGGVFFSPPSTSQSSRELGFWRVDIRIPFYFDEVS